MTDTSRLVADEPESAALALVRLAITAKTASEVGWPHLATAAARECRRLADQVVIDLSPARAKTTVDVELADVGGTATLGAALAKLYGRALDESEEDGS
jgi:hypothetical protein